MVIPRTIVAMTTLVFFFGSGCTTLPTITPTSTLPGNTMASPQLEKDTLFMVMGMDRAEDGGCGQRKVVNREIIEITPERGTENWIIDRCGKLVRYKIIFTPSPRGGTDIGLFPGEVVGTTTPLKLPKTFSDVWYRTDEVQLLLSYKEQGTLVVTNEKLQFTHGKGTVEVPISSIKNVFPQKKLAPDIMNTWVVIEYRAADKDAIIAFKYSPVKDLNLFTGKRSDDEIYSAISWARERK